MKKTLFLELNMGASGDMLMGALYQLVDKKEEFLKKMNILGFDGVKVEARDTEKSGIAGINMAVIINGEEEVSEDVDFIDHHHHHDHDHHHHKHCHKHDHEEVSEDHSHCHHHHHGEDEHHHCHEDSHVHSHHHDHDHHHHDHHDHHHSHSHSTLESVTEIIKSFELREKVKEDAIEVYKILGEAESKAHNKPIGEVHFHEVGTIDAIYDIVGVCLLIDMLEVDEIIASPIHVGSGFVKCAHGIMPVPAPATANILMGLPYYQGAIKGELCTPTGAALLKHFVGEFRQMPTMKVEKVGYGMGKKDFEAANTVRAFLGSVDFESKDTDTMVQLQASMDDITGEEIGYLFDVLFENGALEVFTGDIKMKKNRPGILLTVLVEENNKESILKTIFKHTTTIGIKEIEVKRQKLNRREEIVSTEFGNIRKKVSSGFGVEREKFEFEDLKKIAQEKNMSIRELKDILLKN